MDFVFRADASTEIGSGHVMRCLTLAEDLRERGGTITFISRELSGHLCGLVADRGFSVLRIPGPAAASWHEDAEATERAMRSLNRPASWLIVDHYGLDRRWEERLRPLVKSILVIDDLADRPHDCDLLLDQNLGGDRAGRYDKLVPARCRRLIGPRYALLRREFRDARAGLRGRDGSLRRILVFFGGSDPSGETLKTLDALTVLNRKDLAVDVVVGASNPRQDEVRSRCAALPNTAFHSQISTMAALMAQADLAVGAGGTANWERCFLGLPAITIIIAGNQQASTDALAAAGAVRNLGRSEDVTRDHIAAALNEMIASPALLRGMSERAFAVMGEADRTEDRALIDMLTGGEHGAS